MDRRTLNENECKMMFTLNTWTDLHMTDAKNWLEQGFYVCLASSAMGHTMAEMVENEGIKRIKEIYGERVEVVIHDGWGDRYCHLLNK